MATEEEDFYTTEEEHSPVPRVISGIAIVGLVLAGVIGVWTWQAGSDATSPKRNSSDESTIAISTDAASQDYDVVSDEPSSQPKAPSYSTHRPEAGDGANFRNIAPLGQDPYLPPNAWNGRQTSNVQPSRTIVAEGLDPRATTQAPTRTQTQAPAQPQPQPQPQTRPEQDNGPIVPPTTTPPTKPSNPTKPTRPTQPSQPTDQSTETPIFTNPTEAPSVSDNADEPAESTELSEPTELSEHAEPTEPSEPTDTTAGPKTTTRQDER
ncbi:hypothetical protein [uncultured Corynebacterium sp.]|uniref:hypothetical protein n=1 Tax=uncultured Corynebacterium sp. TaxID=159447 RepID=UPI0025F32952|nr:hypothetical protein [uncultured Corynebacterium sp.]